MSEHKRIPSLDGLRGIAASMVVFGHTCKALENGHKLPFGMGIPDGWGPVGVSLFFVLSGFLITRLLIEERRERGEISLRAFYLRRTFRILPAYWAYLAVVAALAAAGWVVAGPGSLARALSFTTDYLNPHSWVVNHSWSLSVEEQFYLLWPAVMLLAGSQRARKIALALIVATPFVRIAWYFGLPDWRDYLTAMLHLRVDALMIGCWAALELDATGGRSRRIDFLATPAVAAASAFYIVCLSFLVRRHEILHSSVGYTIEAFGGLSIIVWAMRHADSRVGRMLNSAPFVHLGLISYSLYLWQQLWMTHEAPAPVWYAPLRIVGAVTCAELSYRLVEKPMLKLRASLSRGSARERLGRVMPIASVSPVERNANRS